MRIVLIVGEADAAARGGADAVVRARTADEVAAAYEHHEIAQVLLGADVDAPTALAVVRHAVRHHQATAAAHPDSGLLILLDHDPAATR